MILFDIISAYFPRASFAVSLPYVLSQRLFVVRLSFVRLFLNLVIAGSSGGPLRESSRLKSYFCKALNQVGGQALGSVFCPRGPFPVFPSSFPYALFRVSFPVYPRTSFRGVFPSYVFFGVFSGATIP